jgi:hypothetical protein
MSLFSPLFIYFSLFLFFLHHVCDCVFFYFICDSRSRDLVEVDLLVVNFLFFIVLLYIFFSLCFLFVCFCVCVCVFFVIRCSSLLLLVIF